MTKCHSVCCLWDVCRSCCRSFRLLVSLSVIRAVCLLSVCLPIHCSVSVWMGSGHNFSVDFQLSSTDFLAVTMPFCSLLSCLSIHPSVYHPLSVYPSVCMSIYPSVCLSCCLSIHLSVCHSIWMSIHLSVLLELITYLTCTFFLCVWVQCIYSLGGNKSIRLSVHPNLFCHWSLLLSRIQYRTQS